MHFFIDENEKVKGFHIESWDRQVLGDQLVEKINSYQGKKLNDFLSFILKEKLFLKLGIFYMMGNNETVFFWASSACLGSESMNQLIQATKAFDVKNSKYAIIKLRIKGQDDKVLQVIVEDNLSSVYKKFNYPSKEFLIEMDTKDAKEISTAFNVSRNRRHMIRVSMKGLENKRFIHMELKGVKFVGINKDQTLEIMDVDVINKFSKKDSEKYLSLAPTITEDKDEIKEIVETIERIMDLTENKTEDSFGKE